MRPVPVLRRTMDYLLSLADIAYDERLLEVYRFLWDRTRGIRQDMVVQDIKNAASIQMHEEMVRMLSSSPEVVGKEFTVGFAKKN
jgi:hypothetical protein